MGTIENIALTTKIKSAFILDDRIEASGIDVDTVGEGVVHLRGHVPTDVEAKLANDLAGILGAHQVVDELTFDRTVSVAPEDSPAASGAYGQVTTSAGAPATGMEPIEMRIRDALATDSRVNLHLLRIALLPEGRVKLSGRQGTVQERDAALEVVQQVPGVTGVLDEIEIQPAY